MSVALYVTIRLATPDDSPAIAAIYAPIVRDTHLSAEFDVPSAGEMRRRIAETLESHAWLVAELGGEIFGYAYATRFRSRPAYQWSAEVSVYIRPDHHRRGLGRALYNSLFACLRLQGFQQAIAVIALPNPPSVALHESLGFLPVGIFPLVCFKRLPESLPLPCRERVGVRVVETGAGQGIWYDIGWWRLPLLPQDKKCIKTHPALHTLRTPQPFNPSHAATTDPPPTLRTPGELIGTFEWDTAVASGIAKCGMRNGE